MKHNPLFSRRLGVAVALLALAGAMVFVALRTGPLAPVKVTLVRVALGDVSPSIFGLGTVEARRGWMVGPTTAGRVLRVLVDVGDSVKSGQLLAEMDPVDLGQRLQALDASLARAGSARLAVQAQLSDAQARRTLAWSSNERNLSLAAENFISAGALESRQQELVSANAALRAAQANLAGAGQELQRLAAEHAGLAQQRGSLRLLAPADAVVTSRDAEAGSTVNVYANGVLLGAASFVSGTEYSFTTAALLDGAYSVTATATDATGNLSAEAAPRSFIVDTVAPSGPAITSAALTNDSTPVISGSAEVGSTVTVVVAAAVTVAAAVVVAAITVIVQPPPRKRRGVPPGRYGSEPSAAAVVVSPPPPAVVVAVSVATAISVTAFS